MLSRHGHHGKRAFKPNNRNSVIKDHLACNRVNLVLKTEINLYSSFTVLENSLSECSAKIHEVLLIKQNKPLLNKKLYGNGCRFLLKIF